MRYYINFCGNKFIFKFLFSLVNYTIWGSPCTCNIFFFKFLFYFVTLIIVFIASLNCSSSIPALRCVINPIVNSTAYVKFDKLTINFYIFYLRKKNLKVCDCNNNFYFNPNTSTCGKNMN
jgi:hypothetical protein